ncbi:hypothetical protein PIB30_104760 [Stylosanthes scabra]|uniref:Uncharacterized protein n=1 Tax=Stylosanthes scabra TaxID=79078 RepID=A0ABU6XXC5_9FABA|nr:hypothetical protein [Stylosanthes scabra]
MPRMKRTVRKQPMEDVVYEEPPQDHPLGKYFKTLDDLNGYMLTFSDHKEIPPSLFDGKHALESWGPNIKQHAYDLFNIQRQSRKKLSCSVFNTKMRVLHYILNYILMPMAHEHGHVTDDDLVIMYAMVNEVTINWTYFIVQHVLRFTKGQSSTGFGYVCLWSRIFNHFRIDLSEEVSKTLGNSGVIDIRTLHHMGRAMEDQGQEEEAPQAHQAPQASHEPQAGPSQPPSMLDLMHVLQRIEQNKDRMDRRFQIVDRRLHRIKQYLEIEEDEDEDQD